MQTFDYHKVTVPTTDGAQLYFECFGDTGGDRVLLLHGGMGSSDDFTSFAKQLSGFRIITLDARGHGKSTLGSTPMTYQQLAEDALRVLDHLECQRVAVIGFSDGGIVGFRLAIQQPKRVAKLVTIGTPHRLTAPSKAILEKVTAQSWDAKFPETRPAYERNNPLPYFSGFFKASQKMWLDTSTTGYPGDRIADISCPTLLVRGDSDHLYSLDEALEQRRVIKNARLLNVAATGHAAFQEQEEICALAIKSFLADYIEHEMSALRSS